jgi:hypothetical protein
MAVVMADAARTRRYQLALDEWPTDQGGLSLRMAIACYTPRHATPLTSPPVAVDPDALLYFSL